MNHLTSSNPLKQKSHRLQLLVLIMAGEAIFFLPFVLPRIFRPTVLAVFEIDNFELGTFYSVYGLVAIFAYLFGGPLADKFPPSKLMSLALFSTALGGVVLYTLPGAAVLKGIYAFWGLSTIFLFWAALMRSTRMLGGVSKQGLSFGLLDGGRGLFAALVTTVLVLVLGRDLASEDAFNVEEREKAFKEVVLVMTSLVFIIGVILFFVLKKVDVIDAEEREKINLSRVLSVMKRPAVWLQSIIIICAYSGYRVTDDFSLLVKDTLGYNEVQAAGIGSLTLWLRPIAAISAGLLADRFSASRMIQWCFGLMLIGGMVFGLAVSPESSGGGTLFIEVFFSMVTTSLAVFALRGLYFAVMEEGKIPLAATGTAVGIASVIGYLPDVYMGPLMGKLLDDSPGIVGHQQVFLLMAGFALVGSVAALVLRKFTRTEKAPQAKRA
ncbi:MAG: nitrate/nitrite transporter NarK [Flavobacteriales bacterium]|jgi:nitrate/nitrite transporter NarK